MYNNESINKELLDLLLTYISLPGKRLPNNKTSLYPLNCFQRCDSVPLRYKNEPFQNVVLKYCQKY